MATPSQSNLITVGAPLHRKPGTTRASFSAHWLRHGGLVTPWFMRYSFEHYTQLHLPYDDNTASSTGLSAEDRRLLSIIDGVAVVHLRADSMTAGSESGYFTGAIVPDERRFLHEESGASAVVRNPPAFELPTWSAEEWRAWALRVGAVEHAVIDQGRSVGEVSEPVLKEWRRLDGSGGETKVEE